MSYTLQQYIDSGSWDEARAIVGTSTFGSGTKAPVIGMLPQQTTSFSTDSIHLFQHP
jgi:hypothetical protein